MTTVLAVAPALPDAPEFVADLEWAGLRVLQRCVGTDMVRCAVQCAPDVVVVWDPYPGASPDGGLYAAARLLHSVASRPMLVFTSEVSAEAMQQSLDAGIDSWVVNGYARERLRPLVQYTQARARLAAAQRGELNELRLRYEERRLVDRAKGILMTSREVDENQAFGLLRSASMQAKLRIGQVSQQVIDAAHYADAINRAGRLRMLSQRIVKLHALAGRGVEVGSSRALLAESVAQGQQSLDVLGTTVSHLSFGDLIDAVVSHWERLCRGLGAAAEPVALAELDGHAQALLLAADRLTSALEGAALVTTLHAVNVSGRQRMLAQRLAKQALLAAPDGELAVTAQGFEDGLAYLQGLPLSVPGIRQGLEGAGTAWQSLRAAAAQPRSPASDLTLAATSEALLEVFDLLTRDYERSMQLLIGTSAPRLPQG